MVKVKKLKISDVSPNVFNPNRMDDNTFNSLVYSIKEEGEMLQPILVDTDYTIIDGEHRWKASKKAGLTEIMAVVIESEKEYSKLKNISFNMVKGEIDNSAFEELIKDIANTLDASEIAYNIGLDIHEINQITDNIDIDEELDSNIFSSSEEEKNIFDEESESIFESEGDDEILPDDDEDSDDELIEEEYDYSKKKKIMFQMEVEVNKYNEFHGTIRKIKNLKAYKKATTFQITLEAIKMLLKNPRKD